MIRHNANKRGGEPAQLFPGGSRTAEDRPPSPAAAHEVVLHGVVIREDGVAGRPSDQELLGRSAALSDQRTVARRAQGPSPRKPTDHRGARPRTRLEYHPVGRECEKPSGPENVILLPMCPKSVPDSVSAPASPESRMPAISFQIARPESRSCSSESEPSQPTADLIDSGRRVW
jgi:hypothetical protein